MAQFNKAQQQMFDRLAQALGASVSSATLIQELWSGYGELCRVELNSDTYRSVIVKHIKLPQPSKHPRGWLTDRSHQRKLRSYQVEVNWYENYVSVNKNTNCPMPKCLFVEKSANEILLVLEDLQTLGFDYIPDSSTNKEINTALRWLANFHAEYLTHQPKSQVIAEPSQELAQNSNQNQEPAPEGLWPCGSYWHLDTRPDELAALKDQTLKNAAAKIDAVLKECEYQTIVHGDAKLANFVFTTNGNRVAAVDFQYVGRGCGMKDIIMLLSSTVPPEQCEQRCPQLLDSYFHYLQEAITQRNNAQTQPGIDFKQLEQAWRPLYPLAWADFQRFLKGWSPEHWKIHEYSEKLTKQAVSLLQYT